MVNEDQKVIEVADGSDLWLATRKAGPVDQLAIARKSVVNPPTLTRRADLYSAVHEMVTSRHDELVVVDEDDPQKVAGILSRSDLVAAYDRQFLVRDIP